MPIGTNSIFHVEVATIVTERLTSSFETARCRSFLEKKKKICGAFAARTENELNCWVGSLVSLNTKVADRIPVSFQTLFDFYCHWYGKYLFRKMF